MIFGATILAGKSVNYEVENASRHLYLVPARGKIQMGEIDAKSRDGVAMTQTKSITITALEDSEVVLVDTA